MNGNTTPYRVTVTTDHDHPLTQGDLARLAQLGGVSTSDNGKRRTVTSINVDLHSDQEMDRACSDAVALVQKIAPGRTAAVEILTVDEFDRRLAEPTFPELAGLAEAAEILGLSRQRVAFLQNRPGFPAPIAVLRSGPMWRKADLYEFVDARKRGPGRTRRLATSQ